MIESLARSLGFLRPAPAAPGEGVVLLHGPARGFPMNDPLAIVQVLAFPARGRFARRAHDRGASRFTWPILRPGRASALP